MEGYTPLFSYLQDLINLRETLKYAVNALDELNNERRITYGLLFELETLEQQQQEWESAPDDSDFWNSVTKSESRDPGQSSSDPNPGRRRRSDLFDLSSLGWDQPEKFSFSSPQQQQQTFQVQSLPAQSLPVQQSLTQSSSVPPKDVKGKATIVDNPPLQSLPPSSKPTSVSSRKKLRAAEERELESFFEKLTKSIEKYSAKEASSSQEKTRSETLPTSNKLVDIDFNKLKRLMEISPPVPQKEFSAKEASSSQEKGQSETLPPSSELIDIDFNKLSGRTPTTIIAEDWLYSNLEAGQYVKPEKPEEKKVEEIKEPVLVNTSPIRRSAIQTLDYNPYFYDLHMTKDTEDLRDKYVEFLTEFPLSPRKENSVNGVVEIYVTEGTVPDERKLRELMGPTGAAPWIFVVPSGFDLFSRTTEHWISMRRSGIFYYVLRGNIGKPGLLTGVLNKFISERRIVPIVK
jgi:hypothetical protein